MKNCEMLESLDKKKLDEMDHISRKLLPGIQEIHRFLLVRNSNKFATSNKALR